MASSDASMWPRSHAPKLPTRETALPGRAERIKVSPRHAVLGSPTEPPFPPSTRTVTFGMGCFWGAEKKFWETAGVFSTQVGYAGGFTPNPTYREVCSGATGHTEVVRVVFETARVSLEELLRVFWENHDPTQGMRQGNDEGTQYRSYVEVQGDAEQRLVEGSRAAYRARLKEAGYGEITTEIVSAGEFYYAEDYHQQYLAKNPGGYCGLGGTGVTCPAGVGLSSPTKNEL